MSSDKFDCYEGVFLHPPNFWQQDRYLLHTRHKCHGQSAPYAWGLAGRCKVALQSLLIVLGGLALYNPTWAQNTCFTDPDGATICSTASGVVHGNTNSTGQSIYRDTRGNQLDFESDRQGRSSVQLSTGEPINWISPPKLPLNQTQQPAKPAPLQPGSTLRSGPENSLGRQ